MSTATLPERVRIRPAPVTRRHTGSRRPNFVARVFRGRLTDAAWVRPSLIALLFATAVLYVWGLGASGWANTFYSAAVQAGTKSWKAFFFGSSDAANFITVDKAPASLWVMELSARVFGLSSWSILVPQALEGVAAVGVLYATIRRWFSPGAALLAGAVMALTPVAALMFRFNNPDALLVLLLTGSAYCITRALEAGRTKWIVLAFSLVGFAFLAKMLQALVIVPAFGLVYLYAAPVSLGRRVRQLALGAAALLVSGGWWVAIVELIPASSRPYIGGSQNNSILDLMFGYNGFGRLTGNETGSVGGGGTTGGQWGATGWSRMFGSEFGGQIAWLLPAALILLTAGLVFRGRARRTDRARAALLLWGGWLLITVAVFSFGKGIIHPYYAVALAPAIGALVGIGGSMLWKRRSLPGARAVMAGTLAATGWWTYQLLDRTPNWNPWLRPLVLGAALVVAAGLLLVHHLRGRAAVMLAIVAIVVALSGSAAYTLSTVATTHSGAIPSAGPSGAGGLGFGGRPGGAPTGAPTGATGGTAGGNAPTFRGGASAGGLLNGSSPSAQLVSVLDANADQYTWVAAAVGSNQASGYQLATDDPVMAIGGFNGTDPSPTLAQFEQYVAEGKIHYFISGGTGGGGGAFGQSSGSSTSSEITTWVTSHFTSRTVGGVTLYDLTSPTTTNRA